MSLPTAPDFQQAQAIDNGFGKTRVKQRWRRMGLPVRSTTHAVAPAERYLATYFWSLAMKRPARDLPGHLMDMSHEAARAAQRRRLVYSTIDALAAELGAPRIGFGITA